MPKDDALKQVGLQGVAVCLKLRGLLTLLGKECVVCSPTFYLAGPRELWLRRFSQIFRPGSRYHLGFDV